MKKSAFYITGACLILSGAALFVFGMSMFTYQGNNISPLVSKLGMYSFFGWMPVTGFGIAAAITGIGKKRQ